MTDLSEFAEFFEAVLAAVDAASGSGNALGWWDDRIDAAAEALSQEPAWKERLAAVGLSGPAVFWEYEYRLGKASENA